MKRAILVVLVLAACTSHQPLRAGFNRSRVVIADANARVIAFHQVKVRCRYICGIALDDPDLETEGWEALHRVAALEGSRAFGRIERATTLSGVPPLFWSDTLSISAEVIAFAPEPIVQQPPQQESRR